jgi:putative membrane protein
MFETDPATVLTLIVLVGLYAGVAWRLKRMPFVGEIATYTFGLVALGAALIGPLDQLAKDRSFAAYIFQQLVLVFVVPPLLLSGTPDWMLRPVLLNRWVEPVARFFTRPVFAFIFFGAVFTLIHFPLVCDRVCHVHPLYGDVHTLLLFTGLLLWFPLLSPLPEYPRLSYPMQIMYIFLLTIPMTAVAAPITMARTVLYTYYVEAPHPLGLTPIADQVVGGIIMWVGQAIYLMFVFSAIFFCWAKDDAEEMPPINRRPATVRLLPSQNRPTT